MSRDRRRCYVLFGRVLSGGSLWILIGRNRYGSSGVGTTWDKNRCLIGKGGIHGDLPRFVGGELKKLGSEYKKLPHVLISSDAFRLTLLSFEVLS